MNEMGDIMNSSSAPASSAWSRFSALTRHAFKMEFRQKNGLAGLILFSIASVYTCYQVAGSRAEAEAWNALAWVVLLFSAFNAVAKSWPEDAPEIRAYLIHVVRPQEWVLARITFFSLLLCGMSSIVFIAFTLFLGTEHFSGMQAIYFFIGMLLTSVALASLLAMIQALAVRANGGFGLIAVLGLPLIIPVILIATRYGMDILHGISFADTAHNLLFLGTLSGGFGALGFILFPYLWSD